MSERDLFTVVLVHVINSHIEKTPQIPEQDKILLSTVLQDFASVLKSYENAFGYQTHEPDLDVRGLSKLIKGSALKNILAMNKANPPEIVLSGQLGKLQSTLTDVLVDSSSRYGKALLGQLQSLKDQYQLISSEHDKSTELSKADQENSQIASEDMSKSRAIPSASSAPTDAENLKAQENAIDVDTEERSSETNNVEAKKPEAKKPEAKESEAESPRAPDESEEVAAKDSDISHSSELSLAENYEKDFSADQPDDETGSSSTRSKAKDDLVEESEPENTKETGSGNNNKDEPQVEDESQVEDEEKDVSERLPEKRGSREPGNAQASPGAEKELIPEEEKIQDKNEDRNSDVKDQLHERSALEKTIDDVAKDGSQIAVSRDEILPSQDVGKGESQALEPKRAEGETIDKVTGVNEDEEKEEEKEEQKEEQKEENQEQKEGQNEQEALFEDEEEEKEGEREDQKEGEMEVKKHVEENEEKNAEGDVEVIPATSSKPITGEVLGSDAKISDKMSHNTESDNKSENESENEPAVDEIEKISRSLLEESEKANPESDSQEEFVDSLIHLKEAELDTGKETTDEDATVKSEHDGLTESSARNRMNKSARNNKEEFLDSNAEKPVSTPEDSLFQSEADSKKSSGAEASSSLKRKAADSAVESYKSVSKKAKIAPGTVVTPEDHYKSQKEQETPEKANISAAQKYKRFQNIAVNLIKTIEAHRFSSPFLTAVNAQNYKTVIKHPKDLKSILKAVKQKQEHAVYTTVKQLERDIILMFTNCVMFNKSSAPLVKMAQEMKNDARNTFKIFEDAESGLP